MRHDPDFAAALAAVDQPVERAHGLPNALYAEPESLKLERERVFHAGWSCVGFGAEVPNPGDVRPIDHLSAPLLLARDRAGALRVFENVCRHRGMILVAAPRNVHGVIRCPYHSWCYSLDGRLRATPHVGGPGVNRHPALDPERNGLTELRSAVFMDAVFATLSAEAPTFDDWIAPLRARFADFADRPLHHGGPESRFTLEVRANWKLIVENNCESYHLPWVHPGLNSYSRLEDHYHIELPGAFSGQGTRAYAPTLDKGLSFPDFTDLPEMWARGAEYVSLYPNVFVSVHRDHVWLARLEPAAHDRTLEHVAIYYATEEAARGERLRGLRETNAALWRGVLSEDVFVTEGMQRGRGAPGFAGGVFSAAMDGPTHRFHAWIASRLRDG